jgi:hypothetical protein
VTPEQRVTAAIDCTPYAKATPDAYADAALDAVRDALTSDDPEVVRAMAERVGLVEERATAPVWTRCTDPRCTDGGLVLGETIELVTRWQRMERYATPWREVPDA